MVAGAEPKEDLDDDDLSEEGRESLKRYLAWEAAELKSRRHDDIMEKFGGEPGISVSWASMDESSELFKNWSLI